MPHTYVVLSLFSKAGDLDSIVSALGAAYYYGSTRFKAILLPSLSLPFCWLMKCYDEVLAPNVVAPEVVVTKILLTHGHICCVDSVNIKHIVPWALVEVTHDTSESFLASLVPSNLSAQRFPSMTLVPLMPFNRDEFSLHRDAVLLFEAAGFQMDRSSVCFSILLVQTIHLN